MSITKVRSFHDLASIYRWFISNLSTIMALLTECMNGSKFAWTDEADATFHIMKERLMAAPILALPDLTHEFELHTDTSKV